MNLYIGSSKPIAISAGKIYIFIYNGVFKYFIYNPKQCLGENSMYVNIIYMYVYTKKYEPLFWLMGWSTRPILAKQSVYMANIPDYSKTNNKMQPMAK